MFFAHWSSTETSYRDMERQQMHCDRCNKETEHTFRYHTQKTKHYSAFSFGDGDKSVSIICHGCLLERGLDKDYEKEMIEKFDCEIAVTIAHQYMEDGKPKDSQKLLKKLLKKQPKYGPGVFAMAKCLISQTKYDEAEIYVKNLEMDYPNNTDVEELRRLIMTT
jgi:hypothetical protein